MSTLRRFFTLSWQNWAGFLIILGFALVAIFGGRWMPVEPSYPVGRTAAERSQRVREAVFPQPPNEVHWLGTLRGQRDVLYGLVTGARQALIFSLQAGLLSALIGVLLGAVSGYLGGFINQLAMRVSDGLLAIPVIASIVMLQQVKMVALAGLANGGIIIDPSGAQKLSPEATALLAIDVTLWAIVLVNWIPYARLTNGMVIEIKNSEYIEAARSVGVPFWRLIIRHLIPNAVSPALVLLARDMGWLVILQASLNFAGFGGTSIWGMQLLQGRDAIIGPGGNPFGNWWVWLPGTVVLLLYGIGWNLIGDGLNDALNPKETREI